jgi:hypothetical protein
MKHFSIALVAWVFVISCAEQGPGVIGPASPGSPAQSPATTPSGPSPTDGGQTLTLEVWFASVPGGGLSQESLFVTRRTLPQTKAVARAALTELLEGPTQEESAAGVYTAVPGGVEILGLTIEASNAIIDLSQAFEEGTGGSSAETMQLAQVVYTLTQFDTVDAVEFRIEGEPVEVFGGHGIVLDHPQTRRDFRRLLPSILVESPFLGERVDSPIAVAGTADVFEATVSIRILDAEGRAIEETSTIATCGTGCRGSFEANVAYDVSRTQQGIVMVFEASAKDGSPINVVEIPVILRTVG